MDGVVRLGLAFFFFLCFGMRGEYVEPRGASFARRFACCSDWIDLHLHLHIYRPQPPPFHTDLNSALLLGQHVQARTDLVLEARGALHQRHQSRQGVQPRQLRLCLRLVTPAVPVTNAQAPLHLRDVIRAAPHECVRGRLAVASGAAAVGDWGDKRESPSSTPDKQSHMHAHAHAHTPARTG